MNDRITLTLPTDTRFRGVATLVLGGVGTRLSLPYERVDDLQLAVLSLLEASGGERVTVEVEAESGKVFVSVGPLDEGSAADGGLARVLDPLRRLGRALGAGRGRLADAPARAPAGLVAAVTPLICFRSRARGYASGTRARTSRGEA